MRVIVNTKTGIEDAGEVVRWCDEWAIVALDDGRVGPIYYDDICRVPDYPGIRISESPQTGDTLSLPCSYQPRHRAIWNWLAAICNKWLKSNLKILPPIEGTRVYRFVSEGKLSCEEIDIGPECSIDSIEGYAKRAMIEAINNPEENAKSGKNTEQS